MNDELKLLFKNKNKIEKIENELKEENLKPLRFNSMISIHVNQLPNYLGNFENNFFNV